MSKDVSAELPVSVANSCGGGIKLGGSQGMRLSEPVYTGEMLP